MSVSTQRPISCLAAKTDSGWSMNVRSVEKWMSGQSKRCPFSPLWTPVRRCRQSFWFFCQVTTKFWQCKLLFHRFITYNLRDTSCWHSVSVVFWDFVAKRSVLLMCWHLVQSLYPSFCPLHSVNLLSHLFPHLCVSVHVCALASADRPGFLLTSAVNSQSAAFLASGPVR